MAHQREPLLDIHPDDAPRSGLPRAVLRRIESAHGETVLRSVLRPRSAGAKSFAAMHWTDQFASAGPIGRLVGAAADPVSGQPELKATPISLKALKTAWRGLLVSRTVAPIADKGFYWSRIAVAVGSAFELAGWRPLTPDGEPPPAASGVAPARRAAQRRVHRLRRSAAGAISATPPWWREGSKPACSSAAQGPRCRPAKACSPRSTTPSRRTAGPMFSAGVRPGGTFDPAAGRTVCACFAVGLQAIQNAIRDDSLESVEEIGAALRAGTNCGSCIPELKQILRECAEPALA